VVLKISKKTVETVESFAEVNVNNLSEHAAEIVAIGEMQDKILTIDAAIEKKFGELLAMRADLVKEATKRLKNLREALDALYADKDPEQTFIENAGTHAVEIGKKGNLRKITDMKLVQDLLEDDEVFYQLIKMDLKDIDNYLTPPEREAVLETTHTPRQIAITPVVRVKV